MAEIKNANAKQEERPLTQGVKEYIQFLEDANAGKPVEEEKKEKKKEVELNTVEYHSIKPFRGNGKLGVIVLDNFAHAGKMFFKITIAGKEFIPIGYDTFGNPVISEENFAYYRAMKYLAERKGETLVPKIEFKKKVFCVKTEAYDSIQGIQNATTSLKKFKEVLINRKYAARTGITLNEFIAFEKYILASDGRVYEANNIILKDIDSKEAAARSIYSVDEMEYYESNGNEVHIPDEKDVCAVCGKSFDISDVAFASFTETKEASKVHKNCLCDFVRDMEHQKACEIIDAVYDGRPSSEVVYDDEQDVNWYLFKTNQGTIGIRFKTKVIEIKWFDNFKPFNMKIFDNERVTKYDRGIHAWSKDDAIHYLVMAKKA